MVEPVEALQKQTLASSMYDQLRREIIDGSLPPDTNLNISKLCERFSVGLSPMREALSRLSAEGLVRQADNRGFAVKPVTIAELVDLTQARCWINEVGLRQSVLRGSATWEEAVLVAFHRLARTSRHSTSDAAERNPEWEFAHRIFHRSLIEGCGSHWIVDTCERLFDAAERYRHLARRAGVARGNDESEHRAIMQATIDRNADEAVTLLNAHFRKTSEIVQNAIAQGIREQASAEASSPQHKPAARRRTRRSIAS